MPNESLVMMKKTFVANLVSGVLITSLLFVKLKHYAYIYAIGLTVGELNLLLNTFVTNFILLKINGRQAQFYIISFILRIFLIAIIGFIFFTNNIFSTGAYILGYTSHFIGIFIYSHGNNNTEKGSD